MLAKSNKMALPMLKRCCGCISLETGCFVMCIASTLACLADIAIGSWNLPRHREREPEDNLISMSMVMFSTLSAISNIAVLIGITLRRPGYLQLSILFNSVFILCIFLVTVVTCLFSPELRPFMWSAGNIAAVVLLLIAGAVYSLYYLIVVNSLYSKMKMTYGDSAIPV